MTKPTNKQEALDQIDSLRAYIEDCDKPKRVRVYVKEDADTSYAKHGQVYDFIRADNSGGYWITGEGTDTSYQEVCVGAKYCIVVEGELPPNDTKE